MAVPADSKVRRTVDEEVIERRVVLDPNVVLTRSTRGSRAIHVATMRCGRMPVGELGVRDRPWQNSRSGGVGDHRERLIRKRAGQVARHPRERPSAPAERDTRRGRGRVLCAPRRKATAGSRGHNEWRRLFPISNSMRCIRWARSRPPRRARVSTSAGCTSPDGSVMEGYTAGDAGARGVSRRRRGRGDGGRGARPSCSRGRCAAAPGGAASSPGRSRSRSPREGSLAGPVGRRKQARGTQRMGIALARSSRSERRGEEPCAR
jgi:hypothetical protein